MGKILNMLETNWSNTVDNLEVAFKDFAFDMGEFISDRIENEFDGKQSQIIRNGQESDLSKEKLNELLFDDSVQTSHHSLAMISDLVYDDINANTVLPEGVSLLEYSSGSTDPVDKAGSELQTQINNSINGLQVELLENQEKDEVIIAFRGTDELIDWITNLSKGNPQYTSIQDALDKYISELIKKHPHKKITFTGTSLGGGLAEIAGYMTQQNNPDADISLVSFNGFGAKTTINALNGKSGDALHDPLDSTILANLNSTLYSTKGDIVSYMGEHITNTEIKLDLGTLNLEEAHSLDNMLDYFNDNYIDTIADDEFQVILDTLKYGDSNTGKQAWSELYELGVFDSYLDIILGEVANKSSSFLPDNTDRENMVYYGVRTFEDNTEGEPDNVVNAVKNFMQKFNVNGNLTHKAYKAYGRYLENTKGHEYATQQLALVPDDFKTAFQSGIDKGFWE